MLCSFVFICIVVPLSMLRNERAGQEGDFDHVGPPFGHIKVHRLNYIILLLILILLQISWLQRLYGLRIARLDLSRVVISDAILPVLRDLPFLRDLDMSRGHAIGGGDGGLTDAGLEALQGLPLTSLSLSGQPKITDAGLAAALLGMPLVSLALQSCRLVTNAVLRLFLAMPMEKLKFGGTTSRVAEGLEVLSELLVVDLELSLDAGECANVAEILRGMRSLRKLALTLNSASDVEFGCLRDLPLRKLEVMFGNSLTDVGLEVLRGMALESVSFVGCPRITDAGVRSILRGLPLQSVHFVQCYTIAREDVVGSIGQAGTLFDFFPV